MQTAESTEVSVARKRRQRSIRCGLSKDSRRWMEQSESERTEEEGSVGGSTIPPREKGKIETERLSNAGSARYCKE